MREINGSHAEVEYVSVSDNEMDIKFMEMKVKHRELGVRGAEILLGLLKEPPIQMNNDWKTILTCEIFSLVTGYDYLEILTQYQVRTNNNAQEDSTN